jgi:hypothetical protein
MANNDACRVGVGFGQREFPDIIELVLVAVDNSVVSRVADGDTSL